MSVEKRNLLKCVEGESGGFGGGEKIRVGWRRGPCNAKEKGFGARGENGRKGGTRKYQGDSAGL